MFNKLLETSYGSWYSIAEGMKDLMQRILGPVLMVIGVLAVVYAVYLGVMYAKAEDASKRKEVQGRLIGALVGAAIIVVGIALCYAIDWVDVFNSFSDNDVDTTGKKETTGTIANLVRMMVR